MPQTRTRTHTRTYNSRNPAVSPEQYRLAQAVVSGTARETGMPVSVARELIEKTPKRLRREWSGYNTRHNPPKQRYLDGNMHGYPESEYERAMDLGVLNFAGPTFVVHRGAPAEVLRKHGKRVLVRADWYGTPYFGWTETDNVITEKEFVKRHGYSPREDRHGNPGSTGSEGVEFVLGIKGRGASRVSQVESVLFDKAQWTQHEARAWLERNGFKVGHEEEGREYWRYRQAAPGGFEEFATIPAGRRGHNPASEAESMYESFHGTPSTQTVEITEDMHYHEHLAELGVLVGLKVRLADGSGDMALGFGVTEAGSASGNPQKWILPYRRGKKNYEDVGYLPFALEHDIGFSGSKMYRPVKVGEGGQITVASSELHSVDYDRYSRKSALAAVKELAKRYGHNPHKRKGRGKGPLTQAYEFGSGIIPGILQGADRQLGRVVGNPPPEIERLYHQAMLADELFHRALEEEYGSKRAGDMRYQTAKHTPSVSAARERMRQAQEQYRSAVARMRRGNPSGDAVSPVLLCSNEAGTQLYFRGGDQSLNLAELKLSTAATPHDIMLLGECWAIAYSTKKDFDNFDRIEYVHIFGPEKLVPRIPKSADLWEDARPPEKAFGTGQLPALTYDALNGTLQLAGGIYKIEKPLMGTSPGIED